MLAWISSITTFPSTEALFASLVLLLVLLRFGLECFVVVVTFSFTSDWGRFSTSEVVVVVVVVVVFGVGKGVLTLTMRRGLVALSLSRPKLRLSTTSLLAVVAVVAVVVVDVLLLSSNVLESPMIDYIVSIFIVKIMIICALRAFA